MPSDQGLTTAHPDYSAQSRTERLIAAARVILAVAALLTLWFDPTQPARYHSTYAILGAYVLYSLGIAALAWRAYMLSRRSMVITHGVDLVAFLTFLDLVEGPPISPFFVFFVFALFSATLRWNWRGTVWTAICLLPSFGAMGAYEKQFVLDEIVYLGVVAGLLGYMGAHEQRRRREIAKLAAWPADLPSDLETVVRDAVAHAASTLGVPRVLLAWEEPEEPWRHFACLSAGQFQSSRELASDRNRLVASILANRLFVCSDVRAGERCVVLIDAPDAPRWRGEPIERDLVLRFAMIDVLSLPLRGEGWKGRLFVLDKGRPTIDDISLGRIVGQQIAARLDHHYLLQWLQQSAAAQERMSVARDLHDGLLQSLTGVALQLQAALRLLADTPARAEERLREAQRQIVAGQQSLRGFIRDLRPIAVERPRAGSTLSDRLRELCDRAERQWNVAIALRVGEVDEPLPTAVLHDALHIAHEALSNAVRHGEASEVGIDVTSHDTSLTMRIVDNGRGFPVSGRFGLVELTERNLGPTTIKERVAARRGQLLLTTGSDGTRLEIDLPGTIGATPIVAASDRQTTGARNAPDRLRESG